MSVAIFTVELTGGVTAAVSINVDWSVNCDDSSEVTNDDFANRACPSGMETIAAGETSATFTFMTFDDELRDELREGTESFTVSIVAMTSGDFNVVFDDGMGGSVREFVSELNLLDDEAVTVGFEGRAGPSSMLDGEEFGALSLLSVEEGEFVDFRLRLDETVSETETVALPWEISFVTASSDDFTGRSVCRRR